MRRNLRPISGRNTAHLVIKIPTDWPNPGGTTTPTAHIGERLLPPPKGRELEQGLLPATCRAASRSSRALRASQNIIRTQTQSKHSSRSEKETASRMFFVIPEGMSVAEHDGIDSWYSYKKKAAAEKKYDTKNHEQKITNKRLIERTNASTHTSVFGARIQNSAVSCKMAPGIGGFLRPPSPHPTSVSWASQCSSGQMEAISKLRGGPDTWDKNWHHRS